MTELIVALDGHNNDGGSRDLAYRLKDEAGVRWIKVGPLSRAMGFHAMSRVAAERFSIFYDEKLADHGPYVVTEFVKRLASIGIAAVSTSTDEATEQAIRAAEGTELKVWRHVAPTSQEVGTAYTINKISQAIRQGAHGVICGGWHLQNFSMEPRHLGTEGREFNFVCPAVRFDDFDGDEHVRIIEPKDCVRLGITDIVVGRPIWRALDPVAVTRRYMEALKK